MRHHNVIASALRSACAYISQAATLANQRSMTARNAFRRSQYLDDHDRQRRSGAIEANDNLMHLRRSDGQTYTSPTRAGTFTMPVSQGSGTRRDSPASSRVARRVQKARRSKVNAPPLPLARRLCASRRRSATAARFAARHRPYLVCLTKFSCASEMHNRMLNSIAEFS
jgi:hypothetical protein